jgi:hypothetical protein
MDKKKLSREHEEFVANAYGGKRSRSSGASDSDKGDVRTDDTLFECKLTGGPGETSKIRRSTILKEMEKIADEAWAEGRSPALCLRYFAPDSPFASKVTGWVDFTVRLMGDDIGGRDGSQT